MAAIGRDFAPSGEKRKKPEKANWRKKRERRQITLFIESKPQPQTGVGTFK